MKLDGAVCCLSVAILVAPSVGRELPIEVIVEEANIHHNAQQTVGHRRTYPESCLSVEHRVSGVYSIQPEWPFRAPMLVYCDQEYESGGWTVIQRRIDGRLRFRRSTEDYAHGFGSLDAEFWLGLDNIYRLVKSGPHELVILLEHFSGNTSYARYGQFEIDKGRLNLSEEPEYSLWKIDSYTGTAGNGLSKSDFSTLYSPHEDCAWRQHANLNGDYVPQDDGHPKTGRVAGLCFANSPAGSIKSTKIMVRPTNPKK